MGLRNSIAMLSPVGAMTSVPGSSNAAVAGMVGSKKKSKKTKAKPASSAGATVPAGQVTPAAVAGAVGGQGVGVGVSGGAGKQW